MLVVVDMQPQFEASNRVIDPVRKLIHIRRQLREPIVFLEYLGNNGDIEDRTHDELREMVRGYNLAYYRYKVTDDGSNEVKSVIDHHHFETPENILVCGVNRHCCVADTITGLATLYPKTKIKLSMKGSATYSRFTGYWEDDIPSNLVNLKNVRIV